MLLAAEKPLALTLAALTGTIRSLLFAEQTHLNADGRLVPVIISPQGEARGAPTRLPTVPCFLIPRNPPHLHLLRNGRLTIILYRCGTMTPRLTEWGQRCSRKRSINGKAV